MNIIPRKKIILNSRLSNNEIYDKLIHLEGYEVSVKENSFKMKRKINYRNSFLPQITLTLNTNNSNLVNIVMKLHSFVLIFMLIWLAFVAFFGVITIINISYEELDQFSLIPFFMFVFGLLMLYVPFSLESAKSRRDLLRVLDAEVVK